MPVGAFSAESPSRVVFTPMLKSSNYSMTFGDRTLALPDVWNHTIGGAHVSGVRVAILRDHVGFLVPNTATSEAEADNDREQQGYRSAIFERPRKPDQPLSRV